MRILPSPNVWFGGRSKTDRCRRFDDKHLMAIGVIGLTMSQCNVIAVPDGATLNPRGSFGSRIREAHRVMEANEANRKMVVVHD
jgi:hypothetical protein